MSIVCIVRTDFIVCPECTVVQSAHVTWEPGHPRDTYVHGCVSCGYLIMESEWDTAESPLRSAENDRAAREVAEQECRAHRDRTNWGSRKPAGK